jgi:nogalonic acid methyl ester cyclase/aklanonic acid methyl ester cyclase
MKQVIKKVRVSLLVLVLSMVFVLVWNNNSYVLFATDQVTNAPTFSIKGTMLPLTVINPITDEYILAGTWNMDVNQGRVTNFTADIQVELYDGSNPHSHQFLNFKQAANEVFALTADNIGEIRGTMDLGLNNTIVHRNVDTNITIDRGVLMSVTPDITDLGIAPTIYGLTDSQSNKSLGQKVKEEEDDSINAARQVINAFNTGNVSNVYDFISEQYFNHESQIDPIRGQLRGPTEFVDTVENNRIAFPDLRHNEEAIIAQNDMVVYVINVTGTHTGNFFILPPTGNEISYDAVHIYRVGEDGKIVEHRAIRDDLTFLAQLGQKYLLYYIQGLTDLPER